jgi:hypothetical protein
MKMEIVHILIIAPNLQIVIAINILMGIIYPIIHIVQKHIIVLVPNMIGVYA